MQLFFFDLFKKGPPDAVKTILSIVSFFSFAISFQIEKCSESIGMKFVLYFNSFFEINSQPQIIDSLLAINIFLVNGIAFKVGSSPFMPDIALIQ